MNHHGYAFGAFRNLAVAALFLALTGGCPADKPTTRRLSVLFTTDEHSHLFAAAPELDDWPLPTVAGTGSLKGGVARRMALIAAERTADSGRGIDTIVVSAGDFSQGTLSAILATATSPDLAAMKLMGYDAVALGNHEFDLGIAGLAGTIAVANGRSLLPPLVLTNVTFDPVSAADDSLAALYGEKGSGKAITRARIVTTSGGIKVGIVAALGPSAAYTQPLASPISFTTTDTGTVSPADRTAAIAAIAEQLQPVIDSLWFDDGVQVVVLLGHGGIGPIAAAPGDDELLVAALRNVDLVVSGHTHRTPNAVRFVADLDARQVPVMQPAPYGSEIGRADLLVPAGSRPSLVTDPAWTRFIAVDDRTLPSTNAALVAELGGVIGALEVGDPTFLENTLSLVTSSAVTDNTATLGDLYYYSLGHTTFGVTGLKLGENNVLNLDTDAMLATARLLVTDPTDVALQNNGAIRGDIIAGHTGELAFADIYRLVPNGADPIEASPGYPLVRFYVAAAELYGALNMTVKKATEDSDFFLSPSGMVYAYDTSLSATDDWITRIALVDDTGVETQVIFDKADGAGAWHVDPYTTLVPVVTTLYVGSFAASAGVVPKDSVGATIALTDAILEWSAGGAHVKDHQSIAKFVHDQCAANAGELPSDYDAMTTEGAVPRRVGCTGPYCF